MNWYRRWRELIERGEQARLEELAAEGRTVEVGELTPSDEIVRIGLGFGDEFWRVEADYAADPMTCRVHGGKLVVEKGRRVVDEGRLSFIEGRIRRVVYRV